MVLVRKFTKQEVLKILAEHASRSLPDESKGFLEADYSEEGIEVYFVEEKEKSVN